jgi:3-phosphoglycerate kinase
MQSLNYILNNGVRVVLLLVDFGPKIGSFNNEFSVKDLVPYVESGLDHPAFYCKDLNELIEYNKKIDEDDLKDNCCIVMENINFFQEECGSENFTDELVNPTGKEKSLSLYQKNRFLNELMEKSTIYVNDSIYSFDKYTPTIIDVNVPLKVLGAKIQEQLKKILDFFSIDSKEYALIMGDNDVFRLKSQNIIKNANSNGNEEPEKNLQENILDDGTVGGVEILDYSHEETMITNLLIINSIMNRFKKIFIFGKLAIQFIQFLRHDYDIFDNNLYCINENIFKLIKYILIKAYLLKIEIILPDDFKLLDKE